MPKPASPMHSAAGAIVGPRIAERAEPASGRDISGSVPGLLSLTDALRADIDAIWNEQPDVLVMLADWGDALQMQQRDLCALLPDAGRGADPAGAIGRVGREIARKAPAVLLKGGRLGRLARQGERLLGALDDAARTAEEPVVRGLIERHRAATVRHLGRLRGRTSPDPRR